VYLVASAKRASYTLLAVSRIVLVDPRVPDPRLVEEAARVLRSGGLVGLPTETVYGLAARALDEQAVGRVFEAKGRPLHHPLIAHVEGEEQARTLAANWPERASRLARAFWPGPLTLVVDRASHVPARVAGGGTSIAVRAPSHPVARAVIAELDEPVAAPSANRYGRLSPTLAAHVVKQLGDAVDLVLDAGPCQAGIESTVVDVRGPVPRVLRPGAVDIVALRSWAGDIETGAERVASRESRESPGMGSHHYAPRAALRLASTGDEAVALAQEIASHGERVGLLMHTLREPAIAGVLVRTMPDDPVRYGSLLYRTLHELDDAGVDAIVVQSVPADDAWWAVADRLRRAQTKQ
jgi:L-threonylcarbamoyladenylate synthase